MGKELEIQNDHIDRIVEKASLSLPNRHIVLTTLQTDRVDDQIVMNRARLDRIK